MGEVDDLNARLFGVTLVTSLTFELDPYTYTCDVRLRLADHELRPTRALTLVLRGVSNLALKEFGGGLTQLSELQIEDIRAQQLDRLNYRVFDEYHERLDLFCRAVDVE